MEPTLTPGLLLPLVSDQASLASVEVPRHVRYDSTVADFVQDSVVGWSVLTPNVTKFWIAPLGNGRVGGSRHTVLCQIPKGSIRVVNGGYSYTDGSNLVQADLVDGIFPQSESCSLRVLVGGLTEVIIPSEYLSVEGDVVRVLETLPAPLRSALGTVSGSVPALSSDRNDVVYLTYDESTPQFVWSWNDRAQARINQDGTLAKPSVAKVRGEIGDGKATIYPLPADTGHYAPCYEYHIGGESRGLWSPILIGEDLNSAEPLPFSSVKVVPESEVSSTVWDPPSLVAVVGDLTGKVIWKPSFQSSHLGDKIWYLCESFDPNATGRLESGSDRIYPIPSKGFKALIREGNKTPILSEVTDRGSVVEIEGSTGGPFYCEGYVQNAPALNFHSVSGEYLTSGVVMVPDGTGSNPSSGTTTGRRNSTGMVRTIPEHGVFFSQGVTSTQIRKVDWDSDLPDYKSLEPGTVVVSMEPHPEGAKIVYASDLRRKFRGRSVFFFDGLVGFPPGASLGKEPYRVENAVRVHQDGIEAEIPPGSYSASQLSTSLLASSVTLDSHRGSLYVNSSGLGMGNTVRGVDISGASALGVMPTNALGPHLKIRQPFEGRAYNKFDDVLGTPFRSGTFLLKQAPVDNLGGFSPERFFLQNGSTLENRVSVYHKFGESRFDWCSKETTQVNLTAPSDVLSLGDSALSIEVVRVAEANGPYEILSPGIDYAVDTGSEVSLLRSVGQELGLTVRISGSGGDTSVSADWDEEPHVGDYLVGEGRVHTITGISGDVLTLSPGLNNSLSLGTHRFSMRRYDPEATISDSCWVKTPTEDDLVLSCHVRTPITHGAKPEIEDLYGFVEISGDPIRTTQCYEWFSHIMSGVSASLGPGYVGLESFTENRFVLAIAGVEYGVTRVVSLGTSPVSIQCDNSGNLRFPDSLAASSQGLQVFYRETPPSSISDGEAWVSAQGLIFLSPSDRLRSPVWVAKVDESKYYLNPLDKRVSFANPLPQGCKVTFTYVESEEGGNTPKSPRSIIEDAVSFLRREKLDVGAKVTPTRFRFNEDQLTLAEGDFTVYGSREGGPYQNLSYGESQIHVDRESCEITVPQDITSLSISYFVRENPGDGRSDLTLKRQPWVPSVYVAKGSQSLRLPGDLSGLMSVGCLLRLGNSLAAISGLEIVNGATNLSLWRHPQSPPMGSLTPSDPVYPEVTDTAFLTLSGGSMVRSAPSLWVDLPSGSELKGSKGSSVITLNDVARSWWESRGSKDRIVLANGYPFQTQDLTNEGLILGEPLPFDISTLSVYRTPCLPEYTLSVRLPGEPNTSQPSVVSVNGIQTQHSINGRNLFLASAITKGSKILCLRSDRRVLSPKVKYGNTYTPKIEARWLKAGGPTSYTEIHGRFWYRTKSRFTFDLSLKADYLNTNRDSVLNPAKSVSPVSWGVMTSYGRVQNDILRNCLANFYLEICSNRVDSIEGALVSLLGRRPGDSDGKMSFSYDLYGQWGTPGSMDPITGRVLAFKPWEVVCPDWCPGDPIYDPSTPLETDSHGRPTNAAPNPGRLSDLISSQIVLNDLEDLVLTGPGVSNSKGQILGDFKPRYLPSTVSRLYPTSLHWWGTTLPGPYRYGESSGKPILALSNDAVGRISSAISVTLRQRRFRGYLWDSDIHAGTVRLSVVCHRTPPNEDGALLTSEFLSQGGDFPDVVYGIPAKGIPGLSVGDRLTVSREGKGVLDLRCSSVTPGEGVYVASIESGHWVSVGTKDALGEIHPITSLHDLVFQSGETWEPTKGDTIVSVPDNLLGGRLFSDPLTENGKASLYEGQEYLREGSDFTLNRATGEILDLTPPSASQGLAPMPLVNGPKPLTAYEGSASVVAPMDYVRVPSLMGLEESDSGDYLSPRSYKTPLLDLLRKVQDLTLSAKSLPEEIFGPIEVLASSGPYPGYASMGGVSTASVVRGDLALVSRGTGDRGCSGILELSELGDHGFTVPRFTTHGDSGSFTDASLYGFAIITEDGEGSLVTETVSGGSTLTTLDFSSVSGVFHLDDGMGGGSLPIPVGGVNDYLSTCGAGSTLTIRWVSKSGPLLTTPTTILRVVSRGTSILDTVLEVSGNNGSSFVPVTGLACTSRSMSISTGSPFFTFTPFDHTSLGGVKSMTEPAGVVMDAASVRSSTIWVMENRISVRTTLCTTKAKPRGFVTSKGVSLETSLSMGSHSEFWWDSTDSTNVEIRSSCNSDAVTNGGSPHKFESNGLSEYSSGIGILRTSSFCGYGNARVGMSGVASLLRSTGSVGGSPIYSGSMVAGTSDSPHFGVYKPSGDWSKIQPGDLLHISGRSSSGTGNATCLSGTKLVRWVVRETEARFSGPAKGWSWSDMKFPELLSVSADTLTISEMRRATRLRNSSGGAVPELIWPNSGRVFIVLSSFDSLSSDPEVAAKSVISAAYTSLTTLANRFNGLSDYRDGLGNSIGSLEFVRLATLAKGPAVTGFSILPLRISTEDIGYGASGRHGTSLAAYGIRSLKISHGESEVSFSPNSTLGQLESSPSGNVNVYTREISDPHGEIGVHYPNTPGAVDLTSVPWASLREGPQFNLAGAYCLLPSDNLTAIFWPETGVYTETSLPRVTNDRSSGRVQISDRTNTSLSPSEMGFYQGDIPSIPGHSVEQRVFGSVRRCRRFSESVSELSKTLDKIRGYLWSSSGYVAGVSHTGQRTTIEARALDPHGFRSSRGGLESLRVGDIVSAIRDGSEIARSRVVRHPDSGDSSFEVSPRIQGLTVGDSFRQIRSSDPSLEQVCDQLLSSFSEVVYESDTARVVTVPGGYALSCNRLTDDPAKVAKVNPGDWVVVDPMGELTLPTERAKPPMGDQGLVGESGYTQGAPSPLDDNRGCYKVASVQSTKFTVTSQGGTLRGDVISGDITQDGYRILPTVHGSSLNGGFEGQNDLRPTSPVDLSGSYASNPLSIEPFSYRIVRPHKGVSEEVIETALVLRERLTTIMDLYSRWCDYIAGGYQGLRNRTSIRWIYLSSLWDNDIEEKIGSDLIGQYPYVPSKNSSTVLDLRYVFGDPSLRRSYIPSEENFQVILDDVLRSPLRDERDVWLKAKLNPTYGTVHQIRRSEDRLLVDLTSENVR